MASKIDIIAENQPNVKIVLYDGKRYVLKRPRVGFFARFVSSILLKRSFSILRRLQGIDGIPKCVSSPEGLLMEYIEGEFIHRLPAERLTDELFDRIQRLILRMHKRNVVHLDLRQRKNLLITDDGLPFLIDFETSIRFPDQSLVKIILPFFVYADLSALVRIKHRYFPQLMTDDDKKFQRRFNIIRYLWFFRPFKIRQKDIL